MSWLSTTAGQAEQTAVQARAAASAYETALAATVPPAEIATNRTQLLSLLQTNIFGQKRVVYPLDSVGAREKITFDVTIKPGAGKEFWTLYASKKRFPSGQVAGLSKRDAESGKGMSDRVIHNWYSFTETGLRLNFDLSSLTKRTLEVTTE